MRVMCVCVYARYSHILNAGSHHIRLCSVASFMQRRRHAVARRTSSTTTATKSQVIRYSNYFRNFFTQPDASRPVLIAAVTALGRLASASRTSGVSVSSHPPLRLFDFEAKHAFE